MLTGEQDNFINNFKKCYSERVRSMILLNSPAGTGKSHIIRHIHKIHMANDKPLVVLAPTHKAVSILSREVKNVQTVHAFLRSRRVIHDNGSVEFEFQRDTKDPRFHDNVIIVDECSMINKKMFEAFEELSQSNLVIFVGDHLQLPPIEEMVKDEDADGDKITTTFLSKKSLTFSIHSHFTFTKNMRSKTLASTYMLEAAREAVHLGRMPCKLVNKSIEEMLETFENFKIAYDLDLPDKDKTAIVLAYSNVCVNKYNELIRNRLFNKDEANTLEKYYVGENLVFSGYRCEEFKSRTYKYYTSDYIYIAELEEVIIELPYERCECKDTDFKISKCKVHKFKKGTVKIDFYKITDQNGIIWFKPIVAKDLYELKTQFRKICVKKNNKVHWARYYKFIEEYDADLKYSYASTIHKSQGSQYNTVFVDRTNLIRCTSQDKLLKLNGYYTAISRMIDEVYDITNDCF